MKKFILATVLSLSSLGIMSFDPGVNLKAQSKSPAANYKLDVKKSPSYSGKELEAVYVVVCTNTANPKQVRKFELIKSDGRLKNYFMAEFVLVEKTDPAQTKYYPLGWESTKIKVEDLKSDCMSILSNDVGPVDINN